MKCVANGVGKNDKIIFITKCCCHIDYYYGIATFNYKTCTLYMLRVNHHFNAKKQ